MLAYYGDTAYTETGKLTTAVTKGSTNYPVGTPVQVMVEQNLFYVKAVPISTIDAPTGRGKQYNKVRFYISPEPRDGFIPMQGFKDANGVLQNKIYLAAYEGVPYDTTSSAYITDNSGEADPTTAKFSSIAGVTPYRSITRAETRTMANNRGAGWQLHNIFAASVSQWLMLIEYASYDCQAKIGMEIMGIISERLRADTSTIKEDMVNWLTRLKKQLLEANGGATEAELQKELKRKDKLLDAYLDNILSKEEYQKKAIALDDRIIELRRELEANRSNLEDLAEIDRVLKNIDEEVARYIDNNNQLKVEYILEHLSQVEIYPDKVIVIVPILSEGIVVEKSQYVSREKWCRENNFYQGTQRNS